MFENLNIKMIMAITREESPQQIRNFIVTAELSPFYKHFPEELNK